MTAVLTQKRTRPERARCRTKPVKPYPDFPLFPHLTKRWAKKINGKFEFFGPWEDPYGALARYLAVKGHLHARSGTRANVGAHVQNVRAGGRQAPEAPLSTITLEELGNAFMNSKQRRLDAGDMGRRSFSDYHVTIRRVLDFFGWKRPIASITPAEFGAFRGHLAARAAPITLCNDIGRVRSLFKYAYEAELLAHPMRFGPEFVKPPKRVMREAKRVRGLRLFEPEEVKAMLAHASPQLRAMILLGLNCGMGNTDIAELPKSALDLKAGTVDFPRPKTGISRRAVLWPETIAALKAVAPMRPKAKVPADDRLVFITKYGFPWVRVTAPERELKSHRLHVTKDAICLAFGKLMTEVCGERDGRGFYGLRHTFRTHADEVPDRRAIDLIMGHENGSDISTHYVERISDERLRAVADHVRTALFKA